MNFLRRNQFEKKYKFFLLVWLLLLLFPLNTNSGPLHTNEESLNDPPANEEITPNQAPTVFRMLKKNFPFAVNQRDPYQVEWLTDHKTYSIIYDTLIEHNAETKQIIPGLAVEWFISSDSLHYTFDLRDDVFFSNGEKFTAEHVYFTFDRLINPLNSAYLDPENKTISDNWETDLAPFIDFMEIETDYRITFHLKQPYSPFLPLLSNYYILSDAAFDNGDIVHQIGTGPYRHNSDSSNSTFDLYLRNSNYFKGIAPFEQIEINDTDPWGFLDPGITDFLLYGDPRGDHYAMTKTSSQNGNILAVVNFENQILADPLVREALQLGIDQEAFTEEFRNVLGIPDFGSADENILLRNNTFVEIHEFTEYNVPKAMELLDQAGYPIVNGERFELRVLASFFQWQTEMITGWLSDLNIAYTLMDIFNREAILESGEFDLAFWGPVQKGSLDPAEFASALSSSGRQNFGNYVNAEVDELFKLAEETPVRQERSYYYSQLNELLLEERPFLVLIHAEPWYILTKGLEEFVGLDQNFRLSFTYQDLSAQPLSLTQTTDTQEQAIASEFQLSNYGIYFWKQETVIETLGNVPLFVSIALETNQTLEQNVKIIHINVDDQEVFYNTRIYFDVTEEFNDIRVFREDLKSPIKAIDHSSSLQFYEYVFRGNIQLRIESTYTPDTFGFDIDIHPLTMLLMSFGLFLLIPAKKLGKILWMGKKASSRLLVSYLIFLPDLRKYILSFSLTIITLFVITLFSISSEGGI